MKELLKNILVLGFLVLFLPYTIIFLINGKQGIHQEEQLPELEYRVICKMLQQDDSWAEMEDGTLELMAVLFRTECLMEEDNQEEAKLPGELYENSYQRVYQAVADTRGQAVTIDGVYKELPFHAVSAGSTRNGRLLGEDYEYVLSVDCPEDLQASNYLFICYLTEEELEETLDTEISVEELSLKRDHQDYVTHISCQDQEWQGENFRTLLHLPSSCFWIDKTESGVRLTVKGSGHGFGISLYTANRMIQEGKTWQEIIQKFYKNAECITIP